MRAAPSEPRENVPTATHPISGIAGMARRALDDTRYSALHAVVCSEYAGVIHLGGSVPSQYLKQVAFAAVSQVSGSLPILNEIQVMSTSDPRSGRTLRSAASGWYHAGRDG